MTKTKIGFFFFYVKKIPIKNKVKNKNILQL